MDDKTVSKVLLDVQKDLHKTNHVGRNSGIKNICIRE